MKELLNQLVVEMRSEVMRNLELVKGFEAEIKKLSNNQAVHLYEDYIENRRKSSKLLLAKNLDYLELQLKLIQFVDKYKGHEILLQNIQNHKSVIDPAIDYFTETIEGRIDFTPLHPLYSDEAFINRLYDYYLHHEDYLNCEKVSAARKQLNIKQ